MDNFRVVGDPKGELEFLCHAMHTTTGETLLVYLDSKKGTIYAKPFRDGDIFSGNALPDNKRFSIEPIRTKPFDEGKTR